MCFTFFSFKAGDRSFCPIKVCPLIISSFRICSSTISLSMVIPFMAFCSFIDNLSVVNPFTVNFFMVRPSNVRLSMVTLFMVTPLTIIPSMISSSTINFSMVRPFTFRELKVWASNVSLSILAHGRGPCGILRIHGRSGRSHARNELNNLNRGYCDPLYTLSILSTLLSALVESGKFHLMQWDLVDTFLISCKNFHWVLVTN